MLFVGGDKEFIGVDSMNLEAELNLLLGALCCLAVVIK